MRGTKLALVLTTLTLSIAACGGDDTSSTAGGSGSGGSGGSGTTGGASGTGGVGGTSGSGGSSGTGGSSGQAGSKGDAATPMDARVDTPPTQDATADRPSTDGPSVDAGTPNDAAPDTSVPPDGSTADTSPPTDSGTPDTTPPVDGSGTDARPEGGTDGSAAITLTSTGFTEGMMIPSDFTCAGTNVSPPLTWTAGPAGTLSYALVFTDKTNPLIHSIVYDIPANTTSMPMNVEKMANPSNLAGAKQVRAYDNATYGYLGPCPSGQLHTYEFSIRAIDVAALPGVMTTSTRTQVEPVINMHTLGTGILTGTSNAKK